MLLEEPRERILHAEDGLILDLNILLRRTSLCREALLPTPGVLASRVQDRDLARRRLDEVEEGCLEVGVGLALLGEETLRLVAQPCVQTQRVYQRVLNVGDALFHLEAASLLLIYFLLYK